MCSLRVLTHLSRMYHLKYCRSSCCQDAKHTICLTAGTSKSIGCALPVAGALPMSVMDHQLDSRSSHICCTAELRVVHQTTVDCCLNEPWMRQFARFDHLQNITNMRNQLYNENDVKDMFTTTGVATFDVMSCNFSEVFHPYRCNLFFRSKQSAGRHLRSKR